MSEDVAAQAQAAWDAIPRDQRPWRKLVDAFLDAWTRGHAAGVAAERDRALTVAIADVEADEDDASLTTGALLRVIQLHGYHQEPGGELIAGDVSCRQCGHWVPCPTERIAALALRGIVSADVLPEWVQHSPADWRTPW